MTIEETLLLRSVLSSQQLLASNGYSLQIIFSSLHPNWVLPSRYYELILPFDKEEEPTVHAPRSRPITLSSDLAAPFRIQNLTATASGSSLRSSPPYGRDCMKITVIDTTPLDPAYNMTPYIREHPGIKSK